MCDNVIIHLEGGAFKDVRNQGDLAKIIGTDKVIIYSGMYDERARNDKTCLCPVDMERSAELAGFTVSKNDPEGKYDPFDTHWYRRTSQNN